MAGTIKVDSINADSNLALKIANTAVAFIDATGLRPVAGNLNLDATATSKFYLPSANTVAIQTAGVTGLSISSSQVMTLANALPVTSGGTGVTTSTGTGAVVLGTSPTITTPTINNITSAASTALTLQSAGTTAITVDTAQKVGIGTTSPNRLLSLYATQPVFQITNVASGNTQGTIQYQVSGSTDFVLDNQGSGSGGVISFTQAGSERMRIDSSGNVGIGTTSPTSLFEVTRDTSTAYNSANINTMGSWVRITNPNTTSGTAASLIFRANASSLAAICGVSTAASYSSALTFATRNSAGDFTEAGRFDSSSNFLVGCTSAPSASVSGVQWSNPTVVQSKISTGSGTGGFTALAFYNGNGQVGRIDTSGSSTAYVTSSDYRLKENVTPMTGALAKVAQLKPVTYKWKVDGKDGEGFIAHELAEVCPDAVLGTKDAVDKDNEPLYQGIDVSFLVATLTAALQETKALIDTQAETINALTARMVAVESK